MATEQEFIDSSRDVITDIATVEMLPDERERYIRILVHNAYQAGAEHRVREALAEEEG